MEKKHPEQEESEVFLCNADPENASDLDWKTLRMGCIAYDVYGVPVKGLVPIFVSKEEYMENEKK